MIKNILKSVFFISVISAFIFAVFVIVPKSAVLTQTNPHNVCVGSGSGSSIVYSCVSQGGSGVNQCTNNQECAAIYCPPPGGYTCYGSSPTDNFSMGNSPLYTYVTPSGQNNVSVYGICRGVPATISSINTTKSAQTWQKYTSGSYVSTSNSPVVFSCSPLPASPTTCVVKGDNAPTGQYHGNIHGIIDSKAVYSSNNPITVIVASSNLTATLGTCTADADPRSDLVNVNLSWSALTLVNGQPASNYFVKISNSATGQVVSTWGPLSSATNTTVVVSDGTYNFQVFGTNTGLLGPNTIYSTTYAALNNIAVDSSPVSCGPVPPPPSTYSVNGKVYKDVNGDGTFNEGPLDIYPGVTICLNSDCTGPSALTTDSSGSYTFNLSPGQYTISVLPPSGYQGVVPGPPASYSVTTGAGCSPIPYSPAPGHGFPTPSCNNGNISGLFFMVSNSAPWIQSTGSDIRIDSGFNYQMPAGSYMSIVGSGSTPGLIFAGNGPAIPPSQASVKSWLVGGSASGYPETYSPTNNRTSYNYILNAANQTSIVNLATFGGCSQSGTDITCNTGNAAWTNLPHGTYKAEGNLILNGIVNGTAACAGSGTTPCKSFSATAGVGNDYVFLINGDLQINEEIHVTNDGSSAFFSASGSIKVASSVGEATATSTRANLEGYYSADNDFTILGSSTACTPVDKRLNIAGAVVANAVRAGGEFDNRRDLCTGNANPSFTVTERGDFILNSPALILNSKRIFREVAP